MDYICIDGNNFTLIAYAASENMLGDYPKKDKVYYVLSKMLGSIKKKFDGEFYVCWDTYGGTSFRKELNPEYKSTRDNTRFDFEVIESCKEAYESFGVKSISIPECEGDDALYALCKYLKNRNYQDQGVIISRDEDLIQIVQDGYANYIYNPSKKRFMDIPWYSIVKYKALAGDKGDNIKGVRGIGKKGALKVLSGEATLNESQQTQYEEALKLVDAKLNPFYERNYQYIKETLEKLN